MCKPSMAYRKEQIRYRRACGGIHSGITDTYETTGVWALVSNWPGRSLSIQPPIDRPGAPAGRFSGSGRLVAAQLVLNRVHQGLPGGLDDVVGDADRAPGLVAVARGDEHPCLGRGAFGLLEDAHLVVEELHAAEVWIELFQRLAESVVESVDGAVTRRRRVLQDPLHPHPHGGLGDRRLIGVLLLDDDPIRLEREVGPVTAERALHQELERRLRALELESLVLERLELIEDPARVRRVLVEVDPVFARLPKNVRLARQLRHEHAPMVADRLRVDVLVGLRMLEDG